jgi:hypothetical protein
MTLNKFIKHILLGCFLASTFSFYSQEKKEGVEKTWKDIREKTGYKKSDKYEGPKESPYSSSPTSINETYGNTSTYSGSTTTQPYQGVPLKPQQLKEGKKGAKGPNGGAGTIEEDPNVEPPEEIEIPEVDGPDVDAPDIDGPSISTEFWKWLGIIILILLAAFIIYQIIKNRQPLPQKLSFEPLSEDLNPVMISKTELELRLEESIESGDYKECVRIYFLFAMKELIGRKSIYWKKEKTNIHYLIEMSGKPGAHDFESIVKIYDLVWYGEYEIDQQKYNVLEPQLKAAYLAIEQSK